MKRDTPKPAQKQTVHDTAEGNPSASAEMLPCPLWTFFVRLLWKELTHTDSSRAPPRQLQHNPAKSAEHIYDIIIYLYLFVSFTTPIFTTLRTPHTLSQECHPHRCSCVGCPSTQRRLMYTGKWKQRTPKLWIAAKLLIHNRLLGLVKRKRSSEPALISPPPHRKTNG